MYENGLITSEHRSLWESQTISLNVQEARASFIGHHIRQQRGKYANTPTHYRRLDATNLTNFSIFVYYEDRGHMTDALDLTHILAKCDKLCSRIRRIRRMDHCGIVFCVYQQHMLCYYWHSSSSLSNQQRQ